VALLFALAIGSRQPRLPAPLGVAANGQIAYADAHVIKIANDDGSDPTRLMSLGTAAREVHWSPDGSRLAVAHPGSGVVVTDAVGSHRRVLSPSIPVDDSTVIAWAPDSRRLLLSSTDVSSSSLLVADSHSSSLAPVPQDPATPLSTRAQGAWSPDGNVISFFGRESDDETLRLYLVRPDGSGLRRLATSPANPEMYGGTWAPTLSRQLILYVSGDNVDEPSVVEVFDVATGKETRVDFGFWPSWSQDGSQIAWWSDGVRSIGTNAFLSGTRKKRMIQSTPGYCNENPELEGRALCSPGLWSPDGNWLIGTDPFGKSIVAVSVDGSRSAIRLPLDQPIDPGNWPPASWQRIAP
jgi:Tol biopolymer transport system component